MAEAIGVVSGAITLAETAGKLGQLIKRLRDAPDELLALSNEVNDFNLLVAQMRNPGAVRPDMRPHLEMKLRDADSKIAAIKTFLQKVDVIDRNALDRLVWVHYRTRIRSYQTDLREIRLQAIALMATSNSFDLQKVGLLLEQLNVTLNQQTQRSTNDLQSMRNDGSSAPVNSEVERYANDQTLPDRPLTSPSPLAVVSVRQQIPGKRSSDCRCSCHSRPQTQSISTRLFGALLVGYSGAPTSTRQCSALDCKDTCSPSPSSVRATYYFPAWFLAKAITLAYTSSAMTEPSFSLSVRNVVPWDSAWFTAAWKGDTEAMKTLLKTGQSRLNDVDGNFGLAALALTVFHRHREATKFLLDQGADPTVEDRYGRSATLVVAEESLVGKLSSQIYESCQSYIGTESDFLVNELELPLLHRIVLGISNEDLAEAIAISTCSINETDSLGRTALWWAVFKEGLHSTKTLLGSGADVTLVDITGISPLHNAAKSKNAALVEVLLRHGADPHWATSFGWTALHYAARFSDVETVRILLRFGSMIDSADCIGDTPIIHAVRKNSHKILSELLLHGADTAIKTASGLSIFHVAAGWGDSKTLNILMEAVGTKIDPRALSRNAETALDIFERYKAMHDDRRERSETFYRWWKRTTTRVGLNDRPVVDLSDDEEDEEDEEEFFDALSG